MRDGVEIFSGSILLKSQSQKSNTLLHFKAFSAIRVIFCAILVELFFLNVINWSVLLKTFKVQLS